MTRMIWDESGLLIHYISDRLDAKLNPRRGGFIFFDGEEMIGAVCIYDEREDGQTKQASIAGVSDSPKWFTRRNVSDMASMFFDPPPYGMGLSRLNSFIQVDNQHSIEITKRIGFKEEGLMRRAGPEGQDVMVLGMLPEDCIWLRSRGRPAKDD